ncbi:winged helix-turn-helix transcriptional regulator [Spirosoma foliorum]|uniref:Helix-turn-helix transcriptional regulator n=1 Tax=Spirosoma foliorum TaxID=2710596 RepID=A0A7G5H1E4_9BACT|nr:helix-turn-helix domain-containing protein [Spirosoma foliorum]QMW04936.1 helix-turn-helix transcriptional regulator [Spirosoma foliorum]
MKTNACSFNKNPHPSPSASLKAIADTIYVIGGKWRLQIIVAVSERPRRFNELQRLLTGISARVLSNELKELELIGFIVRRVDAQTTPVLINYTLADYSFSLHEVVQAMIRWGLSHQELVKHSKP